MSKDFVIRYDSRSMVAHGQEPMRDVGTVYVQAGFGRGVYSHTYKVAEATRFTLEEAESLIMRTSWSDPVILPAAQVTDLR